MMMKASTLMPVIEGRGFGEGRGQRSKKGMPIRNSNGRYGRLSHRSFTVRDVGGEVHDKMWTDVCGSSKRAQETKD